MKTIDEFNMEDSQLSDLTLKITNCYGNNNKTNADDREFKKERMSVFNRMIRTAEENKDAYYWSIIYYWVTHITNDKDWAAKYKNLKEKSINKIREINGCCIKKWIRLYSETYAACREMVQKEFEKFYPDYDYLLSDLNTDM